MRSPSLVPLAAVLLVLALASPPLRAARQDGQCRFPSRWEGAWFQSGVRQPIYIERDRLSSKGRCVASEGDKFVVVNDKGVCFRCVVIHEKHINVLQYKETFCHPRESLPTLCSLITGDALLYSMFRVDAAPVVCPFRGPFTFTYNRGHGECASPVSSIDSCTEDSRLLLRYQACPDVHGTESTVEELQCLATWKEGSSRYLVGKVHHSHATSNEDRYRCFVYEKSNVVSLGGDGIIGGGGPGPGGGSSAALSSAAGAVGGVNGNGGGGGGNGGAGGGGGGLGNGALGGGGGGGGGGFFHAGGAGANGLLPGALPDFRVAQSGDATCNGLFSPNEGSRTMTLRKAASPLKCRFPQWLTVSLHWHTLDYSRIYAFSHRNYTLRISNASAPLRPAGGPGAGAAQQPAYGVGGPAVSLGLTADAPREHQDMRVVCSDMLQETHEMAHLVAHFTMGCQSGFMCMMFYKRDGHVIEVQTGAHTRRMEDACLPTHFDRHSLPFVTLVTTSPELRECPHMGKFSVTGVQRGRARRAAAAAAAARRARGQRDLSGGGAGPAAGGGGGGGGAGGGGSDDFMPEEDACPDAFLGTLAVGCASADTMEFRSVCTAAELVHSYSCHGRWEDNGTHFLITTPLSRRSHGARRLCFMYREADGGGVVRFSSSAASCRRDIRPGVGGGLAFNVTSTGQCVEIGSSSAAKATLLLVVSLAASVQLLALQLLTPR